MFLFSEPHTLPNTVEKIPISLPSHVTTFYTTSKHPVSQLVQIVVIQKKTASYTWTPTRLNNSRRTNVDAHREN